MKFARLLVLLSIVLSLGACQTLMQREEEKTMKATLRAYEAVVRWGRLEQTHNFLQPELAKTESPLPDSDNIKVTRYEVTDPPAKMGEHAVSQTVSIRYVFTDRQIERTLVDRQLWEYDPETEKWGRINPIPAFQ